MTNKRVAIIEAGTSGLAAIKCCLEEGLEPVCYEKTGKLGGIWHFRENKEPDSHIPPSVYRSTVTNSSKEMMAFSDFPMPKKYPNFLHNTCVKEYLNSYVKTFDLQKYIHFHTKVTMIDIASDYDCTGQWTLEIEDINMGNGRTETFDAVLVCNGHQTAPIIPSFPGLKEFQGEVLHTREYRQPNRYEEKRILVVGTGDSACDVATEVGRVSSKLFLSTRRGKWIVPRIQGDSLPIDIVGIRRFMDLIPNWILQKELEKLTANQFSHMHQLKPKHGILEHSFTINDEIHYQIGNGNIVLKPGIKSFTKHGAEFEDGTVEDIDCVIFGTGYTPFNFPMELTLAGIRNNEACVYKNVFNPELKHPTLAFVGFIDVEGSVNPVVEMQCRWAARVIKGITKLPTREKMRAHIKRSKEVIKKKYIEPHNPAFQLTVDFIAYMDDVAEEIGVKPRLAKLFFEDPRLAIQCFFGPCYPYQYRLMGPGKWDGAKEAIETAWDRITGASQTGKFHSIETRSTLCPILVILGVTLLFISIVCFVVP